MKFNLRDLFWLLLAVALTVGWVVDHRRQHREAVRNQFDAEAALYKLWNESDTNLDQIIQNLANENRRLRSLLPQEE